MATSGLAYRSARRIELQSVPNKSYSSFSLSSVSSFENSLQLIEPKYCDGIHVTEGEGEGCMSVVSGNLASRMALDLREATQC